MLQNILNKDIFVSFQFLVARGGGGDRLPGRLRAENRHGDCGEFVQKA